MSGYCFIGLYAAFGFAADVYFGYSCGKNRERIRKALAWAGLIGSVCFFFPLAFLVNHLALPEFVKQWDGTVWIVMLLLMGAVLSMGIAFTTVKVVLAREVRRLIASISTKPSYL